MHVAEQAWAQVLNLQTAGAAAAVIINADDGSAADLMQSQEAVDGDTGQQAAFALISQASGDAVRQRAEQQPELHITLAVPEGVDVCGAQQQGCAADAWAADQQASCPAEQPAEGQRALGLEVMLTPQVCWHEPVFACWSYAFNRSMQLWRAGTLLAG